MPHRQGEVTPTQLGVGTVGIILTLIANIGVVVVFATSIQGKLDHSTSVSIQNCQLIKSAIILSIEQSKTPQTDPQVLNTIRQNFERIDCSEPK